MNDRLQITPAQREVRSRFALIIAECRDKLQTAYDWHSYGLHDQDVGRLNDLISFANTVLGEFKQ